MNSPERIKREAELTKTVEEYFHAYFEGLHRYAFTLLQDNDDAKDAVQAVFLKFWEKREEIDERQSPKTYLYVAVYHHCLNIKRHLRVRHQYAVQQALLPADRDDALVRKETHQRIMRLIESLPPRCQLIFIKSRFEQKKYAEIATELAISLKTVEVQMGKALRILRKELFECLVLFIILWLIKKY